MSKSSKPTATVLLFAALMAVVVLAGCGSERAASPSTPVGGMQLTASRTELRACLREHGVELADQDAVASLSEAELTKANALLKNECREATQAALKLTEKQSEQYVTSSRTFFVCLKERGLDVPDPAAADAPNQIEKLDQNDPKVKAAVQACLKVLPTALGGTAAPSSP